MLRLPVEVGSLSYYVLVSYMHAWWLALGFLNLQQYDTLPEANNLPLKIDGWKMICPFWERLIFRSGD